MRGHALGSKRRNRPPGRGDMQIETVREAVPAHGPPAGVEEQVVVADRRPHLQPPAEDGSGLVPQRQFAFALALARDVDALESRLRQAVERARSAPTRAAPRRSRDAAWHGRAAPGPCWCRGHRAQPASRCGRARRPGACRLVCAGSRAPASQVEATRDAVFQIAEEGFDGGQAGVPRADAVVAVLLQVLEEGDQQCHREVLDHQGARAEAAPLCRVEDEQLVALGVALHGVPAQAPLAGQVVV